jgi:hypothetical protein
MGRICWESGFVARKRCVCSSGQAVGITGVEVARVEQDNPFKWRQYDPAMIL